MNTMILGVSLFANVVLIITLISVLLFGHTGLFSRGSPSPGVSAPGTSLGTPTVTANSASPTTGTGWLQVTPNTVHLTCSGDQNTQKVVLANTGPRKVQWQASFPNAGDSAPISVSPNQGELHAGATVEIQIQISSSSNGSQGIISFNSGNSDAGASPTLSYIADNCNNGG